MNSFIPSPNECVQGMSQEVCIDNHGRLWTYPRFTVYQAEVGQIARITAVDDTGVATEWEAVDMPNGLPSVTADDNDKFLRVVSGAWAAASIPNAGGVAF